MEAIPASASGAFPDQRPPVAAAIASVLDADTPILQEKALPAGQRASSSNSSVTYTHIETGRWELKFRSFLDEVKVYGGAKFRHEPVVHVTPIGSSSKYVACYLNGIVNLERQTNTPTSVDDVRLQIQCMDDHGAPINQAFSVAVSEGGAEEGSVADMQIHTAMTQNGSYTPDFSHADTTVAVNISQSSSISRTSIGRYTFTRERLPGAGAESFVVDAVHRHPTVPNTVCHIVSAGPTGSGNALEQISVACDTFTHAGNSIPADPIGVAVSYSRDASLI
ncbi:hypothetical protein, partial [Streptomyces sp. NPDC002952]|uniref:hypothetical protein n=1 Tax=Streptomyces sp. NPDC002952 TaxID=3364673 RepID=UPI0036980CEB